jgi:DNA-binding IclR family transcriptional regulator
MSDKDPANLSRKRNGADADAPDASADPRKGSQTMMRGLDLIEAVANGMASYGELADKLGLSRSTAHRLAHGLVERGYLAATPRLGYRLGPKLLELGFVAQSQTDLVQIARPHLETLSMATEDTVRLGVLQNEHVVYIDVVSGTRRITIANRPGDAQPLTTTSAGKALMLDDPEVSWKSRLAADLAGGRPAVDPELWLERMKTFARAGYAYGLAENDDDVRGVAAPVRSASGAIVAAVSVSSVTHYMNEERMSDLSMVVRTTAQTISRELGNAR